jgi:peptide/nickel transport system permease protein
MATDRIDMTRAAASVAGAPAGGRLARRPRTLWQDSLARLLRNPAGVAGLVVLVALPLAAILAPLIAPYDPIEQAPLDALQGPSAQHLFGTDQFGRDILSRLLYGGRYSLPVGIISVGIAAAIGVPLGLAAGYYRGWVESWVMRVMDVMLAFPGILLSLTAISILGPGLNNVMIAVGVSSVPAYARLVRSSTLQLRSLAYVEAARASGASSLRVIAAHILPNILAPLIVLASLGVGTSLLAASGLSFLGLGAQPPSPEWGAMLSTGRNYIELAWWITTFPGLVIVLAVLATNLLGDALRDALDPRLRRR